MTPASPSRAARLGRQLRVLLAMIALLWLVELANGLEGRGWNEWGIFPRSARGARGILVAPLLHAGPRHLLLNSLPLFVLGYLVLLRGCRAFLRVTLFVAFVSGALVWLLARPAYHLGASGVVLGYFAYLVAAAFAERSARSVLLASLTLFVYGGLVLSILPVEAAVSWESHLAGALAGAAAAWLGVGRPRAQSGSEVGA